MPLLRIHLKRKIFLKFSLNVMFLSIFYCIRYCKSQFTHKGDANKNDKWIVMSFQVMRQHYIYYLLFTILFLDFEQLLSDVSVL